MGRPHSQESEMNVIVTKSGATNIVTLPRKMSGTGSIYDLNDDRWDISIRMRAYMHYIVILPAYFNARHSRHKTSRGALRAYDKLRREGYATACILDRDGQQIDAYTLR